MLTAGYFDNQRSAVSDQYKAIDIVVADDIVLLGLSECGRFKARIPRKPETYVPGYFEAFRGVITQKIPCYDKPNPSKGPYE